MFILTYNECENSSSGETMKKAFLALWLLKTRDFGQLLNLTEAAVLSFVRDTHSKHSSPRRSPTADSYSLSLNIDFSVFDNEKEKEIKLLQTGLTTSEGEPYQHSADTSPLKYMVDGEMCIVPEEFCPHCWGEWQFKFKHTTCPECGYELGNQVKYLLDDDTCPYCQEGTVTINNPVCDSCEEEVDPQKVVRGQSFDD